MPMSRFQVLDASGSVKGVGATGATGATGAPGSGGGIVLLEQHTAASSASLDFTSWSSSSYDEYEIHIVSLVPATNASALRLEMSIDGGSTWDTTSGHYSWAYQYVLKASAGEGGSDSDTSISLFDNMNSASKISQSGKFTLFNPGSTSLYKTLVGLLNQTDSSRTTQTVGFFHASKYLVDGSAVNGLRFIASAGNIASGTIRVYGIAKV